MTHLPAQLVGEPPEALGVQEPGDPVGRRGEEHPVPREAGPDPKGDRQMGLPGPGRAEEHDVLFAKEEVELGEVEHHLLLHRVLEGPIELLEGLATGEPRRSDPRRTAMARARSASFGTPGPRPEP